jgi:hypothetical protein
MKGYFLKLFSDDKRRKAVGFCLALFTLSIDLVIFTLALLLNALDINTLVVIIEGSLLALIAMQVWYAFTVEAKIEDKEDLSRNGTQEESILNQESYCLIVPKDYDTSPENCDDRHAVSKESGRYAVADGVAQAFCPGLWAQIVATGFVNASDTSFEDEMQFKDWLDLRCNEWKKEISKWIGQAIENRKGRRIIWDNYERGKEKGSQTTLVGCSLTLESQNVIVKIVAIGDSIFFLLHRDGDLWKCVQTFPYTSSDEFSRHPNVLGTHEADKWKDYTWKGIKRLDQIIPRKDALNYAIVLASDTIAEWMLRQQKQEEYWSILLGGNKKQFDEFVNEQRASSYLEDDLTVLIIRPDQ